MSGLNWCQVSGVRKNLLPIIEPRMKSRRSTTPFGSNLTVQSPCLGWTANRRMSKIELQNYEGWNRYARSNFNIDRIPYFDIQNSTFGIRYSSWITSLRYLILNFGNEAKAKSKIWNLQSPISNRITSLRSVILNLGTMPKQNHKNSISIMNK